MEKNHSLNEKVNFCFLPEHMLDHVTTSHATSHARSHARSHATSHARPTNWKVSNFCPIIKELYVNMWAL